MQTRQECALSMANKNATEATDDGGANNKPVEHKMRVPFNPTNPKVDVVVQLIWTMVLPKPPARKACWSQVKLAIWCACGANAGDVHSFGVGINPKLHKKPGFPFGVAGMEPKLGFPLGLAVLCPAD
jgi:hypothetical protein